jgi:hypothetical protein
MLRHFVVVVESEATPSGPCGEACLMPRPARQRRGFFRAKAEAAGRAAILFSIDHLFRLLGGSTSVARAIFVLLSSGRHSSAALVVVVVAGAS